MLQVLEANIDPLSVLAPTSSHGHSTLSQDAQLNRREGNFES